MEQFQQQVPVLRPAIFQLAESNHLGALQEVYAVPSNPITTTALTFFIGSMAGIPLTFGLAAFMPAGEAILTYFAALVLLTASVLWTRLRSKNQVCLYFAGLIWTRGSATKALRWEQIETFKRGKLETEPTRVEELDWIQIVGPDALQFSMPRSLLNKDRAFLCDTIEREFVNARLPEAIQQFNSSKTVIFRGIVDGLKGGTLSVSQKGLDNGEEILTWSQVESFSIDSTIVVISKKGRTSAWLSSYVAQFPNACLLKALEEQVRGRKSWQ